MRMLFIILRNYVIMLRTCVSYFEILFHYFQILLFQQAIMYLLNNLAFKYINLKSRRDGLCQMYLYTNFFSPIDNTERYTKPLFSETQSLCFKHQATSLFLCIKCVLLKPYRECLFSFTSLTFFLTIFPLALKGLMRKWASIKERSEACYFICF